MPSRVDAPAQFQVDETYTVDGVGTVVSGTTLCGSIGVGDTLLLGPDSLGRFVPVGIKGIHRRRMPTARVYGGQACCLALKKVKRDADPVAHWEFEGEVLVLHHPSTITAKYQAMVHVGSVRQAAALLRLEGKEHLRTGDKALCRFRFVRNPEMLQR